MPALSAKVRGGINATGGIIGYPLNVLRQEVALIALYLHWSYQETMNMEHQERREWIQEIMKLINRKTV
jgi:hypothetical protein